MGEKTKIPAEVKELTEKQKKFADYIVKLGRGKAREAAILAGYKERGASVQASVNLKKANIAAYIRKRLETAADPHAVEDRKLVADGDEVLKFLTATMRGEVKDQFGLDAQLKDRLAAAKELQRIIDVAAKSDEDKGDCAPLVLEPVYGAPPDGGGGNDD